MVLFEKNTNKNNKIVNNKNNSDFPLQGRRRSRMTPTKTLAATATRPPNKREISAKLAQKNELINIII
jgi:hypothetical protein